MHKFLGASVLAALIGLVSLGAFGPKLITSQDHARAEPAPVTTAVLQREHVRHMRAHKQIEVGAIIPQKEETAKSPRGPGAVLQSDVVIDQAPTGSVKHVKPKKTKLRAQKNQTKIQGEREAIDEALPPAETGSEKPRGLFDVLFNGL